MNAKTSPILANSPAGEHYKDFGIEPIVYIEANKLGWHEANVVKYITRWRVKDGVEDLRKARFYIDRLIELEESIIANDKSTQTKPSLVKPTSQFESRS